MIKLKMFKRIKGQVSLELGAAFLCIFLLLLASVKLCVWLAGRMVTRQERYEAFRGSETLNRVDRSDIGHEVDESKLPKLHFNWRN